MPERMRRALNVKVSPLTVALNEVTQGTGGQPLMTPGNQQRRLTGHREPTRPIKVHDVNDGLAGNRVKRNLTLIATLTEHLSPLTSKPVPGVDVTDVKAAELSRTQASMNSKADKSTVTQTERLTRADDREQLSLLRRKQNTHRTKTP